MISVEAAKNIISEHTAALPPVSLPLEQAAGMTLAEDIYATMDIPAFPQSAMDGYALCYHQWQLHKQLEIHGEIAAGSRETPGITGRQAARIFTGAPLPAGADTVVMQEKVIAENGVLLVQDDQLRSGSNVRPRGSEITAGARALPKGSLLRPAALGFLAGIGIQNVNVYPNPTISIIITGSELQRPGKPLQYGQVYDSNSFTLAATLQQLHIAGIKIYHADDDPLQLKSILEETLQQSDLVMLTVGISAGFYYF
jgi:molybdopterin molybdotransferase